MEYLHSLLACHGATLVSFEQTKELLTDRYGSHISREQIITRGKVVLADGDKKYFSMIVDFASLTPEDQRVWLEDAVDALVA